jgi:signal transduction histidine kinase
MASLGRLAATVGHEINNPLAYVLSSISLIERELASLPEEKAQTLRELVANVDEGARRIRDVVEDLRVFSRERTGEIGSVDLVRLLDRAASMASHEVRRRAKLVKDYQTLPPVPGNEARLGQVFLNLLVNAAQAIPEDGSSGHEVRLEARHREAAGAIEVDVVDTGIGIEPTLAAHVFDPFFTTKPGEGTGLGLSISHHIVVSLGGTLTLVSSKPGETRFRVVLRTGSL